MSATGSVRRRRLEAGLGAAAVTVAFGGMFVAAAVSPWFSPFLNALSDLGRVGVAAAPVFNGALLVGGAPGAGFVVSVREDADNAVQRAGLVFLFPATVCLGLVGAFPLPLALHGAVAVPFFFFLTVGVFVWGGGDVAAGRPGRGGALVVGSTLHVAGWVWWAFLGWAGPGVAVPELVGAATLGIWALWVSYDRWPDPDDTVVHT
jgi:hypothetical membrane protein